MPEVESTVPAVVDDGDAACREEEPLGEGVAHLPATPDGEPAEVERCEPRVRDLYVLLAEIRARRVGQGLVDDRAPNAARVGDHRGARVADRDRMQRAELPEVRPRELRAVDDHEVLVVVGVAGGGPVEGPRDHHRIGARGVPVEDHHLVVEEAARVAVEPGGHARGGEGLVLRVRARGLELIEDRVDPRARALAGDESVAEV